MRSIADKFICFFIWPLIYLKQPLKHADRCSNAVCRVQWWYVAPPYVIGRLTFFESALESRLRFRGHYAQCESHNTRANMFFIEEEDVRQFVETEWTSSMTPTPTSHHNIGVTHRCQQRHDFHLDVDMVPQTPFTSSNSQITSEDPLYVPAVLILRTDDIISDGANNTLPPPLSKYKQLKRKREEVQNYLDAQWAEWAEELQQCPSIAQRLVRDTEGKNNSCHAVYWPHTEAICKGFRRILMRKDYSVSLEKIRGEEVQLNFYTSWR